jgi:hypothetical protein
MLSSTRVSKMDTLVLARVRWALVPLALLLFRTKAIRLSLFGRMAMGASVSEWHALLQMRVPFRFASPPRPRQFPPRWKSPFAGVGSDPRPMVPVDHAKRLHPVPRPQLRSTRVQASFARRSPPPRHRQYLRGVLGPDHREPPCEAPAERRRAKPSEGPNVRRYCLALSRLGPTWVQKTGPAVGCGARS